MSPPFDVRVVLVRTRNPLNIGSAARALANFGVEDLALVEPYEPSWKEARSAVGGEPVLKRACSISLEEALADRELVVGTTAGRRRELRQPLVDLQALPALLRERLSPGGKLAILFGSEKTGLRNEDLRHCDVLVRVPTSPATPSMNLAQAVAVVAYELARPASAESRKPELPPPTSEQLDALVRSALGVFDKLGYMRTFPEDVRRDKVRRMLLRWSLVRPDASVLQAVLKRVAARL